MVRKPGRNGLQRGRSSSVGRVTGGFKYIGPPHEHAGQIIAALDHVRMTGDDVEKVLECLAKSATTKRIIVGTTKIKSSRVDTIVAQLMKSGAVSKFRVGSRVVYELSRSAT